MGSIGSSIWEPEPFQTFNQDMATSTVPVVAAVVLPWILQRYESAALKNLDRFKWNQCGIKKKHYQNQRREEKAPEWRWPMTRPWFRPSAKFFVNLAEGWLVCFKCFFVNALPSQLLKWIKEESKMFVVSSKKHFFGELCHFDIYELWMWVTQTAQVVGHP